MRKTALICLCLFACSLCGWAQVVTTNPAFVTEDAGTIEIIFNAALGTGGLKDYTGTVYAHTGVITTESKTDSDWKHVVSDWGKNTDKCKLASLGDNQWKLVISPSIREFYGIPEGEKIIKLAFVFRSGEPKAGSTTDYLEGKADGGKDIFVDVYEKGLNINFASPTGNQLVDKGDTLDFVVNTSITADIALSIGNTPVKTALSATTLTYQHIFGQAGDYTVIATATTGQQTAADTLHVCVPQAATTAARPTGTTDGINITSASEVTFVLYAPEKENVFLIGDFNNWIQSNSYQLKKDGDYWWYTLDKLDADRLYRFQYVVDGTIRISDPYTELVLDPQDVWINEKHERYPDMPSYPTGKTDGSVATFQINRPEYQWEITDFEMPSKTNMVIYELLLRDFTQEQSLQAAIERLDYLGNLGVTAVELMPIQEFDDNNSWGYNPNHYFAPDKAYGSPELYKQFVDECHKRGMAVIMDVVMNHATGTHPFAKLYWDSQNNRTSADNPWFNVTAPHPYSVFHDFNHSKTIVREHFKRMLKYWIEEYHIDGYRLDLSKGLTQRQSTESTAGNYDADRISYLTEYYEAAKEANPDIMFILEHFCDSREENELASKGMYMWKNVNNAFSQSAMGWQENSSFSAMNTIPRNWVGYAESHDEERNFYKAKTWGAGNLTTDSVARLERVPLNMAFATLIPGPKMLWEFGEIGYDVQSGESGSSIRMEEKPSGFIWYSRYDGRRMAYLAVSKMLNLRKRYPDAFNDGYCQLNIDLNDWDEGRRIAITHDDLNMVVIGNFKATADAVTNPNFPKTGEWYELLSGEPLTVTNTGMTITLPPGDVRIYTDRKIEDLPGLPALPDEPDRLETTELQTDMVYPGVTDGPVFVRTSGNILGISIYNLQGMCILHSVAPTLDLTASPAGMYLVKLRTTGGTTMHKIMKR